MFLTFKHFYSVILENLSKAVYKINDLSQIKTDLQKFEQYFAHGGVGIDLSDCINNPKLVELLQDYCKNHMKNMYQDNVYVGLYDYVNNHYDEFISCFDNSVEENWSDVEFNWISQKDYDLLRLIKATKRCYEVV